MTKHTDPQNTQVFLRFPRSTSIGMSRSFAGGIIAAALRRLCSFRWRLGRLCRAPQQLEELSLVGSHVDIMWIPWITRYLVSRDTRLPK